MNTRIILFLAYTLCLLPGLSQSSEFNDPDTLTFDYRTGGSIDTFDLTYSYPYTTIPSTGFSNTYQIPTIYFYQNSPRLFSFQLPKLGLRKIFSALPHIGFSYSFGLKGTQYLRADYQHVLKKNTLLNVSIDRQSSEGFAQNSSYANSVVRIGFFKNYGKIDLSLEGAFSNDDRELYNGVNESLKDDLDSLGIKFVPGQNLTANSNQKGVNSFLSLKFNLLSDSVGLKIGPRLKTQFKLKNRILSDQMVDLRDQFQDATISYGLGLFIEKKHFSISTCGVHRYWRFQNSGSNRDTNELAFQGEFDFKRKNITFSIKHSQNIIGAKGEIDFKSRLRLGSKPKNISAFAQFSDLLPTPIQRFYFGKYLDYNTLLTKQQRMNVGAAGKYAFNRITFEVKSGLLNTTNNLIWTDSSWSMNANSNLRLYYFDTKAHLNLGVFNWYPQVIFQTGSEYLPTFIFTGRILVKKKVFDAKKLELQFSLDPQINTSYKLMSYDVNLDNFYFDSTNRDGGIPFSMHSTFSLVFKNLDSS